MKYFYGEFDGQEFPTQDKLFGFDKLMEFILQHGMRDTLGKLGIAATRTACCSGVLARAKVWRLTVGRDHGRNWDALAPLLG